MTRRVAAVSAVLLSLACLSARGDEQPRRVVDHTVVARDEIRSEEIAGVLLDLSEAARSFDGGRIRSIFSRPVELALPFHPSLPAQHTRWSTRKEWKRSPAVMISGEDIQRKWLTFLLHFDSIEDSMFKPKDVRFDDDGARVALKFYIVGRDHEGRLEWMRGVGHIRCHNQNQQWVIDTFAIDEASSLVAVAPMFTEVSTASGIAYELPHVGEKGYFDPVFSYAHGAAAGDIDGDGLIDLVVSDPGRIHIYKNVGDGHLRDVASEVFDNANINTTAPLLVDYDNDGDEDIFFSVNGRQILLENRLVPDGKLRFVDVSEKAGINVDAVGMGIAAGDLNGDGFTDIYVSSYNRQDQVQPNSFFYATNGTPNLLFLNDGHGHFTEVARQAGVADRRWSFAAEIADLDHDGALDIYVANDYSENAVYLNQIKKSGTLTFRDATAEIGLTAHGFGMGVSVGDYNNDGLLDLHATFMYSTAGNRILSRLPKGDERLDTMRFMAGGNRLFAGTAAGKFNDVTSAAGPQPAGWAWGGGFVDIDNDGFVDLHSANGAISGRSPKDT